MSNDPQKLRYETNFAILQERFRSTNEAELNLLKGSFLANGGAILALLTFFGSEPNFDQNSAFWSFVWFSLGLASSLLASICSMLANSYSFLSDFGQVQKEHGYSDEGMLMSIIELQKKNRGRGDKYFNAFVTFAIVSVAMFVVGAFVALDAIT